VGYELSADALTALGWRDCDRINPAAMPVVSGHDCADDCVIGESHEKKFIINCELFVDYKVWSIVGCFVTENCLPQCNNLVAMVLVNVLRNPDIHMGDGISRVARIRWIPVRVASGFFRYRQPHPIPDGSLTASDG
jgi:hypothetical protein